MATAATAAPSSHLFGPVMTPLLLRFFPVPWDTFSMDRGPLTVLAGVLLAAGNGEPPWLPLFPADALSLSFPSLIGAIRPRSNGLGWPIPFRRGKFVKEPLPFPEIEPAVLSVL